MSEAVTTPAQMTTSLALPSAGMVAPGFDEKEAMSLVTGIDMLPRLQLNGASANLAKEGKVPVNDYVLMKDKANFVALGKTVDCFVLALRMKALAFRDNPVRVYYDVTSPEFKEIAQRAASDPENSGCMAGWDFLVYIPSQKTYASFYLASKSARNEAPAIRTLLSKAMTLTSKMAENKKGQKWAVPNALACTKPLEAPPLDEIQQVSHRFINAAPSAVKVAPAAAPEEVAREQ